MTSRQSIGFTIIELLVVIAIIGLLTAILIPVVMAARAAARRSACMNNMRQVGLAVNEHATTFNGYYPGRSDLNSKETETLGFTGRVALSPVTWVVKILPMLEPDIAKELDELLLRGSRIGFHRGDFDLPILQCPSDISLPENAVIVSYVVNSGVKDPDLDSRSANFVPDSPANGVFHNLAMPENVFPQARRAMRVNIDYISRHDGMASTLMLSENVDAGAWYLGREVDAGFCWWIQEPVMVGSNILEGQGQVHGINVKGGERPPREDAAGRSVPEHSDARFARPSSFHSGGVNAVFCDGHGQFLREDIPYWVYVQLMTPNGKKAMIDVYNNVPAPDEFRQSLAESDYQ